MQLKRRISLLKDHENSGKKTESTDKKMATISIRFVLILLFRLRYARDFYFFHLFFHLIFFIWILLSTDFRVDFYNFGVHLNVQHHIRYVVEGFTMHVRIN